jgi:hypothetical protein
VGTGGCGAFFKMSGWLGVRWGEGVAMKKDETNRG